jgi:cytosine/adenosine deaminase-related metal-dependent hydrolase
MARSRWETAGFSQGGDYAQVRAAFPNATVVDWRGSAVLPGFIDTHVHFPQTRIIGGLGRPLLEWLHLYALPEEERMAEAPYAAGVARQFVSALARNGTTTALVFGAHFGEATSCCSRRPAPPAFAWLRVWCSQTSGCPMRCCRRPTKPIAPAAI